MKPCSIVPGERAPGRRWGMPPSEGAKRRQALCGTPHRGRLAVGPVPSAEGNGRPITRTGAPIGASPRRFPSSPGPPSGNGQGRPFTNALDSTGFPPLSSAPPARCRTDPCSWAGRCLPRPPEARLARPNPQAPPPLRQQAPPVDALCRAGMAGISSRWVTKIKRAGIEICESRKSDKRAWIICE